MYINMLSVTRGVYKHIEVDSFKTTVWYINAIEIRLGNQEWTIQTHVTLVTQDTELIQTKQRNKNKNKKHKTQNTKQHRKQKRGVSK